jgi:hypothetical protein
MEILKLIIGNTALLGFVSAIMWACDEWDTRAFIAYTATAILVTMICVLLDS